MRQLSIIILLIACISAAHAQFGPPPLSAIGKKIQQAVDSDIRTAAEKERDGNRKPRQKVDHRGITQRSNDPTDGYPHVQVLSDWRCRSALI